jgi:hypothetical protein
MKMQNASFSPAALAGAGNTTLQLTIPANAPVAL